MADNKRGSAGKVATPKTAGGSASQSALPDMHEAIGKGIGARVKLVTAAPESKTYEGTLFTADPVTNLLVVNVSADTAGQASDFKVFPFSQIQNLQILSRTKSDGMSDGNIAAAQPSIGPVDVKAAEKRLNDRVRALKEKERDRGQGVSKDGQALFDAFKRINMQIRWHNQDMIVSDAVIITPPYRVEDCKGSKEKQATVQRIKTMLAGERKKLEEKEDKERKTAAPTGPRKGG